jgi:hypothetical protein
MGDGPAGGDTSSTGEESMPLSDPEPGVAATRGMVVNPSYLANRTAGPGVIVAVVPGHGGDVWFVDHADGRRAAYTVLELDADPGPFPGPDDPIADPPGRMTPRNCSAPAGVGYSDGDLTDALVGKTIVAADSAYNGFGLRFADGTWAALTRSDYEDSELEWDSPVDHDILLGLGLIDHFECLRRRQHADRVQDRAEKAEYERLRKKFEES